MLFLAGWAWGTAQAATDEGRYIEVTGTSEVEIVPDEIHYIIEIKEYFAEEFDGKSKEEDYRTKVPLAQIEEGLREALREAGVPNDAVRTQEIGDYWRESGREFLVSKRFDLTLTDFKQIDRIVRHVDTKGIHTMRIGELKNKDMQLYHQKGKIAALMAAREKAAYLVEALGQKLGLPRRDHRAGLAVGQVLKLDGTAAAALLTPAAGKAFLGEVGQVVAIAQGRFGHRLELLGVLVEQQPEILAALVLAAQAGQHPQQLLGALFGAGGHLLHHLTAGVFLDVEGGIVQLVCQREPGLEQGLAEELHQPGQNGTQNF